MISIIAAVGKNLELGKNNQLLWDLKEDMKFFRETTTGKTVVVGKNTYISIGKPLPNRKNIVVTDEDFNDDVINVHHPEEVFNIDDDLFIIGGGQIYNYFLPYANKIYLTETSYEGDADVYFPSFNKALYRKTILGEGKEGEIEYKFVLYEKK